MADRILQPVARVLCFQLVGLILSTVFFFHIISPSESLGATDSLVLTTRIDTSYVDSRHPQDHFLEVVVQAPERSRHHKRRYQRPPLPIALLFGPPPGFLGFAPGRRVNSLVAKNLEVHVALDRKFREVEVSGGDYKRQGRDLIFFSGDLRAGECRRFLIRVRAKANHSGRYNVAKVEMSYTPVGQVRRVRDQQHVVVQYKKNERGYAASSRHGVRSHYKSNFTETRPHRGGSRGQYVARKRGSEFDWRFRR